MEKRKTKNRKKRICSEKSANIVIIIIDILEWPKQWKTIARTTDTVGRICGKGIFKPGMKQWGGMNQRWEWWVDGTDGKSLDESELGILVRGWRKKKPGVDSRDEGKHTGRNYLLLVDKVMWMDERVWPKMKSECCEEAELWSWVPK